MTSANCSAALQSGVAFRVHAHSSSSLPFAPGLLARPFVDRHSVPARAIDGPPPPPILRDVQLVYAKPCVQSSSNALGDLTENLQTCTPNDLAVYTEEQTYSTNANKDVHLFYARSQNAETYIAEQSFINGKPQRNSILKKGQNFDCSSEGGNSAR